MKDAEAINWKKSNLLVNEETKRPNKEPANRLPTVRKIVTQPTHPAESSKQQQARLITKTDEKKLSHLQMVPVDSHY